MNAEVRYYISTFLRRLPLFLAVSMTVAAAAVAAALLLPTVYRADAKLLVEDPQIPTNLAQSTVQVNELEQLAIIQQKLMTRANLLQIAREHDVYLDLAELSPDQIVERMRADTTFRSSGRRDAATLMDIAFSARTGEIAARVTNDYVTRILAANADQRKERAEQTLDFFQQEASRLEDELDRENQEILRFQNENSDALPSTLSYRLSRQSSLQERLSQMARERSLLEEQRARLVELRKLDPSGRGLIPASGPQTPSQRQLVALREQLATARAVYAEGSARVQMLANRVEALETQVAASATAASAEVGAEPSSIDTELEEIDARLQYYDEQTVAVEEELADLRATIERTPGNAITLEALQRDYDNVLRQYNQALDRLAAARTGERIETMSRGQRITVVEQATAPTEPSDPNRPMIALAGSALGVGMGGALVVLLEVLNKAIRRPGDLTAGLGITPLATVPYITTRWERLRRRALILLAVAAVAILVPSGLWYVHYEVMPLDLVYDKIVTEFLP